MASDASGDHARVPDAAPAPAPARVPEPVVAPEPKAEEAHAQKPEQEAPAAVAPLAAQPLEAQRDSRRAPLQVVLAGIVLLLALAWAAATWTAPAVVTHGHAIQIDGLRKATLVHCHEKGAAQAEAWLRDTQRSTYEKHLLSADLLQWRDNRCALDVAHAYDHTAGVFRAAGELPWARLREEHLAGLGPRAKHAIVDRYGRVMFRALRLTRSGAIAQELVGYDDILQLLEQWRLEVRERLEGNKLAQAPCLCPVHFGFLQSGLHFLAERGTFPRADYQSTPPRGGDAIWRVFLDFELVTSRGACNQSRLVPPRALHAFPANVEDKIAAASPGAGAATVCESSWFQGHDLTALYGRSVLERLDNAVRYEWLGDGGLGDDAFLEGAGVAGAAPPKQSNAERPAPGEEPEEEELSAQERKMVYRLLREHAELSARSGGDDAPYALALDLKRTTRAYTQVEGIASGAVARCFAHCQQLEARALKQAPANAGALSDAPHKP